MNPSELDRLLQETNPETRAKILAFFGELIARIATHMAEMQKIAEIANAEWSPAGEWPTETDWNRHRLEMIRRIAGK